jgi:FtsP/CotA-like multicopper oxidase with cupredoxin domain
MNADRRRRTLLVAAGLAGATGLAGGFLWTHRPRPSKSPPPEAPFVPDPAFPNALRPPGADGMYGLMDASGSFTMVGKRVRHALLPGKPAAMLAYEVEHHGRILLNPVLRVRTGA